MIQVKTTETRVEDFVPSSKALATTSITVEMQVRQWEIAATMLAGGCQKDCVSGKIDPEKDYAQTIRGCQIICVNGYCVG